VDDVGCGPAVTGGHYNPTFKLDYATPCTNQAECEVGDLSGKFGRLGVGSSTDMATYSDTQASAVYDATQGSRGSKWIVGRSIVIHKANGDRWACANIGEAGVGVNVAFAGDVNGQVELFQASPSMATAVTVNLDGLQAAGNKWHVHDFPVPASGSCADTGGHYDPMQSVPEYGDLSHSAKHGLLSGTTSSYAHDLTLPLHGAYPQAG
jgi:Cu/Zn superoxide dismutase